MKKSLHSFLTKLLDPMYSARLLTVLITVAGFVYSSAHIYTASMKHGVPVYFTPVMMLFFDVIQLQIYLITIARAKRNQSSPWQWAALITIAALTVAANIDAKNIKYASFNTNPSGVIWEHVYASLGAVFVFLGMKFLASEYKQVALHEEVEINPMDAAYDFWMNEEVNGGRRVVSRELEQFGFKTRTANNYLNQWRDELKSQQKVMIPRANGTPVLSQSL